MKTMEWLNGKFAAGVGAAGLVAFAGGAGVTALRAGGAATADAAPTVGADQVSAQDIAAKSRDAYAALSSYSDSGTVVSEMSGQRNKLTFNIRLQRPNLYRIDWTQGTGPKNVAWSDGSGDHLEATASGQGNAAKPQTMRSMKQALARAAGPSWSSASAIPGAFFNEDVVDVFIAPVASGRHPLQREKDAKVGDVDCYVVSSVLDFSKIPDNKGKPGTASTMLWIGKRDFLIHQCRTKYVEKVDLTPAQIDQQIDEAIKQSLAMQNKPATPEAIAAMRPQMKAIMKQVQTTLKAGFAAGNVMTQTHEHIVVNEKLSPAAFTPDK